jgi:hypothetical protein
MEDAPMARGTRTPADQSAKPGVTWRGAFSLEQREAMIREAAYYRCLQRGFAPGHDLEDWLAAEAELEHGTPAPQPAGSAEFPPELEVQQSSVHGAGADDELKRIIRQHPQKGIPQVEGIEPKEAPLKR